MRVFAWLLAAIYLIGPFQVQLCVATCADTEDCCPTVEPVSCCCAPQAATTPGMVDRNCCIELASEPPIGTLQTMAPAPITLPTLSAHAGETFPPLADTAACTLTDGCPPTGPPLFILFDVLRR